MRALKIVADFETSYTDNTKTERTVVLGGFKNIKNDKLIMSYTLKAFMNNLVDYILKRYEMSAIIYFHNLEYDASYIEDYLLNNNIPFSEIRDGTSKTLYSLELEIAGKSIKFNDSLKLYPMKLEEIGSIVGLDKLVDTYDYDKIRQHNRASFTEAELDYFKHDIEILRLLMLKHFETHKGKPRMTRASYAYAELKSFVYKENRHNYEAFFKPVQTPELHKLVQMAYYGGFSYLREQYSNTVVGAGVTFDVNSLYPSQFQTDFPSTQGKSFTGKQEFEELKDKLEYYIVHIYIKSLSLKSGGVPVLPKKMSYNGSHGVHNLDDLGVNRDFGFTSIDLKHIEKNYNIDYNFVRGVYYTQIAVAPFKSFVQKNNKTKVKAKRAGDHYTKTIAKLTNNSAYGKFAQSSQVEEAMPYLNEKNEVKFMVSMGEPSKYMKNNVVAAFTTAKARDVLFKAIYAVDQSKQYNFIYSDTDSIHLEIADQNANDLNIPIDEAELGYWKHEATFTRAKYLRSKVYIEINDNAPDKTFSRADTLDNDNYVQLKSAGFNDSAKRQWFNMVLAYGLEAFKFGTTLNTLMKKRIKGGYDLVEIQKEVSDSRNQREITLGN